MKVVEPAQQVRAPAAVAQTQNLALCPQGSFQASKTPVPGDPMHSFSFYRHQARMRYNSIHAGKTDTYM